MATQPDPPKGLPKYLAEGVPEQDDATLRALTVWINELLTYRQETVMDELTADFMKSVKRLKQSKRAATGRSRLTMFRLLRSRQ